MEETADLDLEKIFSPTLVDFVQKVTPDLEEQPEADNHHASESETIARVDMQKLKDKTRNKNSKTPEVARSERSHVNLPDIAALFYRSTMLN